MNFERSSVVTNVEDEGLLGKIELFEFGNNGSDAVVHGRDHGEGLTPPLGHFTREAVEMMLGSIEGNVWSAVGEVEEEGIVFLLPNEGERIFGTIVEMKNGVGDGASGDQFSGEVEICVAGRVAVFVVEIVESVLVDGIAGAEMPLADLAGGVAHFFETFGDGEFLVESDEVCTIGFHTKAVLVFPGEQSGSRGDALGSGGIAIGGTDAGGGKSIEVGRFQVIINPRRSDVGPAVVVGVDEDDIGLLCSERKQESEEDRNEFHKATCVRTSV